MQSWKKDLRVDRLLTGVREICRRPAKFPIQKLTLFWNKKMLKQNTDNSNISSLAQSNSLQKERNLVNRCRLCWQNITIESSIYWLQWIFYQDF